MVVRADRCAVLARLLLARPGDGTGGQAAPVVQQDVTTYGEWVATLDGYQNAQIQPQVTGYLLKQNYKEGSFVHKDDVLFEIDPRVFQATLDQAKSQLAQAHGQVAQTKAQLRVPSLFPGCRDRLHGHLTECQAQDLR